MTKLQLQADPYNFLICFHLIIYDWFICILCLCNSHSNISKYLDISKQNLSIWEEQNSHSLFFLNAFSFLGNIFPSFKSLWQR